MSAILGIFGPEPSPDATVHRMLSRMSMRGADHIAVWREGGATLAVARAGWEMAAGFSDGALVAQDGDLVAAADASVYYRNALRQRLARSGVRPMGDTPAHLILAAYRAWGDACSDRLEGDFAFIIWDRVQRRAFCSRDFGGKRDLYFAETGSALIAASTISGVLAHPACPQELNLVSIAETAAGFAAASHETCYRAVRRLVSGHHLSWVAGKAEVSRHWNPEPQDPRKAAPLDEAAEELHRILSRAVEERLAPGAPTAIQLSGGWDSTAIFGTGKKLLHARGEAELLRPVSISYPEGDPGREDETIRAVTERWNTPVHWLDINDIPMFADVERRASQRDEPLVHIYESWNRALVQGGRAVGARVMFDGFGGDSLFQCSPVFFADLLRRGQWISLAREWRTKGMTGWREFFRWAVQPLLPAPAKHAAERLRGGRPLRSYLDRTLPPWLDRGFVQQHGLVERERQLTPTRPNDTRASAELYWYLTYPFITRMLSTNFALGLEGGVEMRSPLYDRRVVEFAIRRPHTDRSAGNETKRLLRRAGKGLLPDDVLAPRPSRTGVTSGYLARSMQTDAPELIRNVLESSLLAEHGLVDPNALARAANEYYRGTRRDFAVPLIFTLQAELWLRSHSGAHPAPEAKLPNLSATAPETAAAPAGS